MSDQDPTFQRLDPIGGYSTRPVTLVMCVGIVAVAIGLTVFDWSSVNCVPAAILAVLVSAIAAGGLGYWSSPLRAPFRRGAAVVILLLAGIAMVLAAVSTWGSRTPDFEQWAPALCGLFIAGLSPYRPTRDLAAATILAGLLAGFLAVLQPGSSHGLFLISALETAIPVLALGFGATAYTSALVTSAGRWYARRVPLDGLAIESVRESVTRDVYHDRVGILNHTVVPYFTELLQREVITAAERDRARDIASSIRSVMVADVDRSWLDAVIDHIATDREAVGAPGSEVVQDPHHLAAEMTTEQRIVVRTVIMALFDHPGFDPDGFAMLITSAGARAMVVLTAKLDLDDSIPRSGLAAYFAVLRIAFDDLSLGFQRPTLTLKFSYEHR